MKTVYLAGAINGKTFEGSTSWRTQAAGQLTLQGFNTLDPMRGKDELAGVGIVCDQNTNFKPENILKRDLWDIKHSNIVLANMCGLGTLPMIGTLMELGISLDKLDVYLFNVPTEFEGHPFFHRFTICKDLTQAIATIVNHHT
jgi:hypothetical protein